MNFAISTKSGFTLVEMTIAIVLTGMLIAAILKGRELYNNVQLQAVYSQLREYEAAAKQFKLKYKYWPGDFKYATTNLVGCTPNSTNLSTMVNGGLSNNCVNGDGTSDLGSNFTYNGSLTHEPYLFFRHMALAQLIDPSTFAAGTRKTTSTRIGKMVEARTIRSNFPLPGLRLIVRGSGGSYPSFNPALSGLQAAYLDQKYDDGEPGLGNIHGRGANGTNNYDADDECTGLNQIYKTSAKTVCMLGLYIDE